MLMEVADRLSLKGELEIARDIQLAMLPSGRASTSATPSSAASTRPANTVGGDFYDILRLPDGRWSSRSATSPAKAARPRC